MLPEALLGLEGDIEFKERLPGGPDLARTVVAFANGRGGRVVVGIRDSPREVVGVDPDQAADMEQAAASAIHDRCRPSIRPLITLERHAGRLLLVITVFPGADKPYHLAGRGPDAGTFIRVGSTTRQADRETVLALTREAWHLPFDGTMLSEAGPDAIDRERVARHLRDRAGVRNLASGPADDAALEKLGAARRDAAGRLAPTVAGLLFFGHDPQRVLPQARVRCARFRGTDRSTFLDQAEIGGTLPEQVDRTVAFVLRNTRLEGRLVGVRREDRPEYPPDVVREAVVNAVTHREYAVAGADVRVAVYDDLIEVTSPGLLPAGVTLSRLGEGVSEARNPTLATLMRDAGYAEQWGRGTRAMIDGMRTWGLPPPRFEETGRALRVTLPGPGAMGSGLTDRQRRLLELAGARGEISSADARREFQVSAMTASKDLRLLIETGRLLVTGKGRATRYRLP